MQWLWTMLAALCMSMSAPGAAFATPLPAAKAKPGQFVDLTPEFVRFIEKSARMTDVTRIKAFHAQFDALLTGYFIREGAQDAFDREILQRMKDFPAQKAKFTQTVATFRAAFERAQLKFRKSFPDYKLTVPVYLAHSMGLQDGGTRQIGKKTVLLFGADVIAKGHDAETIGPFLDHELFHVYHHNFFKTDSDQLWISLWEEGLAVYVASQITPGATDRQLLLTDPQPLRRAIEPRLNRAMCRLRVKLHSTDRTDFPEFFMVGPAPLHSSPLWLFSRAAGGAEGGTGSDAQRACQADGGGGRAAGRASGGVFWCLPGSSSTYAVDRWLKIASSQKSSASVIKRLRSSLGGRSKSQSRGAAFQGDAALNIIKQSTVPVQKRRRRTTSSSGADRCRTACSSCP